MNIDRPFGVRTMTTGSHESVGAAGAARSDAQRRWRVDEEQAVRTGAPQVGTLGVTVAPDSGRPSARSFAQTSVRLSDRLR